jgi:hypothetical protein
MHAKGMMDHGTYMRLVLTYARSPYLCIPSPILDFQPSTLAMSSVASSSPRAEPVGLNRQEVGSVLGMSAVFILTADREVRHSVTSYGPFLSLTYRRNTTSSRTRC